MKSRIWPESVNTRTTLALRDHPSHLSVGIRKRLVLLVALVAMSFSWHGFAQTTQNIPAGSLIIDMGVVPQTIQNGLKPYGLAYELINVRKIPVVWAINSSKAKDGVDFTVDGRNFRGGPFIVEAPYLTDPNVQATISTWQAKGVVTYTTLSDVTVEVYRTINIWPKWVLDQDNGNIARAYLDLAEIPASAYAIGLPSDLDACDDLFILPHADPTWEDHGYLYEWNKSFADGGSEGWIWSGCHAVSVFEALVNPMNPAERMNFLASDPSPYPDPAHPGMAGYALIDFGDHNNGSGGPYFYSNPGDSFMQFMGSLDGATEGGSEQIYLPYPTGSWRPTTTVAVWDPNQSDVLNGDSPGRAAKLAYGHAFGDPERGQVMYEGGHSLLNGSTAERVAAIRAFLNFSFNAPTKKAPLLTDNTPIPTLVEGGDSINFDVDASSTAGNTYTFIWSTSCSGGSFVNTVNTGNNTTTTFTTIPVTNAETCIITLRVIDLCGRESFKTYPITMVPPPTPPDAQDDLLMTYQENNITFNALTNDTDINFNINPASFAPLTPLTVAGGTFVNLGGGNIHFEPADGFVGTATLQYEVCDDTPAGDGGPLCDTATITVDIVPSPCGPNEPVAGVTAYASSVFGQNNWKDSDRALGAPDADYSRSDNDSGAFLVLDLGGEALLGSEIRFRVYSDDGNPYTGSLDAATTGTGFPNSPVAVSTSTQDPATEVISYQVLQPGIRYVRIAGVKNFGVESVEYQRVICLPAPIPPMANDDYYATFNTNSVVLTPLDNDTDTNNNMDPASFTPLSPLVVAGGTFVYQGNGELAFYPTAGFVGTANLEYSICDNTPAEYSGPLCDTATITITIASSGCGPGQYPDRATAYATSIVSQNNWKDANRALGAPDTNFSRSDNDLGAYLVLDLGSNAYVGSHILFRVFSDNGNPFNGSVDAATTATGFPNAPIAVTTSVQDPATEIISFQVLQAGIRYVRIAGVKNFGLESVQYDRVVCAGNPVVAANEDDFTDNAVVSTTGGVAGDATANDTLDTNPVDDADFLITLVSDGGLSGAFIGTGGMVTIPAGTPAGTYVLSYSICESARPSNCDSANITVLVLADTDGDGYADVADLDDDNDGILDTVENQCIANTEVNSPGYAAGTDLSTGPTDTLAGLAANGSNDIDLNYTLTGTATWSGGIQIEDVGGVVGSNTLFLQPNNVSDGNGTAVYEFVFQQSVLVQNITFGGLENDDRLIFEAYDGNGDPITLTPNNFTTTGSVVSSGNAYTFLGPLQSYTAANYVNETVSIALETAVKRIRVTSGKSDGSNGNNTIEVYNFSYCNLSDSDGDAIPDYLETDSDGDGCVDALEAGFSDPDNDGYLGSSPVTVDGNGLVMGQGGYTPPADANANSIPDYQEAGASPTFTTQPSDLTLCPGCSGTIDTSVSDADAFQWQVFNGFGWTDLSDGGIYSGTQSPSLTITQVTTADQGKRFRLHAINTGFVCGSITSGEVTLMVRAATVITNRRITYRVNTN